MLGLLNGSKPGHDLCKQFSLPILASQPDTGRNPLKEHEDNSTVSTRLF